MLRYGTSEDFILEKYELDSCQICKKTTYVVKSNDNLVKLGFVRRCGGRGCFWYTTSMRSAIEYYQSYGQASAEIDRVFAPKVRQREDLFALSSAIKTDNFIELKVKEGFKLREWQEAGIEYCQLAGNVLIADGMRVGKEQPHSSLIMTPNGWTTMGKIQVNGYVIGSDGNSKRVVDKYPQGIKDIYKVIFSDNTEVMCGLEHLWTVRSDNDKRRGRDWRILTTKELMSPRRMTWEIPIVSPINFQEKELLLDPYILGVLIADGSLTEGIKFVPGDKLVPIEVSKSLPPDYYVNEGADYGTSTCYYINREGLNGRKFGKNQLRAYIKEVGLDITGEYKFIPEEYKFSSITQRTALLQGLMDCDGAAYEGKYSYSTTSLRLANDVADLVKSLGGISTVNYAAGKTRIRDGRVSIEKDCYNINIRVDFNPFRAKHFNWKPRKTDLRKFIKSIEFSHREEASCISVDSRDHLYLTNGYNLTHNSYVALGLTLDATTTLLIVPASLKQTWKDFILAFHPNPVINMLEPHQGVKDGYNIINYEMVSKMPITEVDVCILDECHLIKENSAYRTRAIHKVKAKKKLALTGTPILNTFSELLAVLSWLDPKWAKYTVVGDSISDSHESFTREQLDIELRSTCYIRRTLDDVSDSPGTKSNNIYIDCPIELRGTVPITEQAVRRHNIGLHKVPYIVDYCNTYKQSLVVFTYHQDVTRQLKVSLGNQAEVIYGLSSDIERKTAIQNFNSGRVRVLIVSIGVGSVGIDLSSASRILFAEMDWNLLMDQAKERCSNMTKTNNVVVEYLILQGSLDERISGLLKEKDKETL